MNRVLPVGQEETLLQDERPELVPPHGKPHLEPELDEVQHVSRLSGTVGFPAGGRGGGRAVAEVQPLLQVAQHVHPPERRRERGDQEPVVAPRHDRRHRARRIAA
jgi:hypothetical protein